ncbi:MAG: c-type cytochrome [Rhodospirillales bacterium]|nr:c-type cytochrome [Rhodospirillales bacterium]
MKTPPFLALSITAAIALSSGAAFAESDGETLFNKKCGTCHSLEQGVHKVGPSLAGIIGRRAGGTNFANYKALQGASFTWNLENINEWIADPKKFIGKPTAMTVKVKKDDERAAIIAYITGKDN